MLTTSHRRVTESTTSRGVAFKKKEEEPLSAKDLEAKISFIIKDGAQKGHSVDYIAGEIQKMVKENPTAAGKLGLSADFLSLKNMVLPKYQRAKNTTGEKPAGKRLIPTKPPTGTSVSPSAYKKEPAPPRKKLPSDYGTKPGQSLSGKFKNLEREMASRLARYERMLGSPNLPNRKYYEDLAEALRIDLDQLRGGRNKGTRQDKIDLYNRLSYEFHLEVKYNVNLIGRNGAEWSLEELEDVDEQLALLPSKYTVDSPKLREIRIVPDKAGSGGYNDGQVISVEAGEVEWALIHEIGHNFDDENPKWRQFQALSGWKDVSGKFDKISDDYAGDVYDWDGGTARLKRDGNIYQDGDRIDLDGDGNVDGIVQIHYGKVMIYNEDADFVSTYAKTNPKEDFADTFKAFFTDPKRLKEVSPEKFQFMVNYVGHDPTKVYYKPVPFRI